MSESSLFEALGPPPPEWVDDPRMVRSSQLEAWSRWVAESPELVLDYETDGLSTIAGHRPFMVGAFSPDKGAKVLDLRLLPMGLDALRDALRRRRGTTIVHNAKNELAHSWALGTDIGGTLWDNQAASFALDERRESHGQKELCKLFGIPTPMADALNVFMASTFGDTNRGHHYNPNALEVPYSAEDVECAWKLYEVHKRDADRLGMSKVIRIDSEVCRPVTEMELTGIRVDMEKAKGLLDLFTKRRADIYKTLQSIHPGVDPASWQHLFGVLYGHWNLPMHADIEKQGKVDDDVLHWMLTLPEVKGTPRETFIEGVRDWRELNVLINTFLLPWLYEHQKDGILYPHLNLTVADTKRFTADNPNLQNIPTRGKLGKMVRSCIVHLLGHRLYSLDYSQVEYRTFAHCAGEPRLVHGYNESPTFDIHASVSELLNAMVPGLGMARDDGKHVNFGILYGMGIDKLSRKLKCTKEKARATLDAYMAGIPSARRLKNRLEQEVRSKGYISSVLGGRRHLKVQESYKAVNTLCQMTAAEIIRHALVTLWERRQSIGPFKFQLQVHDEILFGIPDGVDAVPMVRDLKEAMQFQPAFKVPMLVEAELCDPSWGEKVPA